MKEIVQQKNEGPVVTGLAIIMGITGGLGSIIAFGMVFRLMWEVYLTGYSFFGWWPT